MTGKKRDASFRALQLRQAGAFTTVQARAVGLSRWSIEERVRDGRWIRLHRGTYVEREFVEALSDEQRHLLQAHAAALAAPADAVLSHDSAARLWRLPLVGGRENTAHVTVARPGVASRARLRVHRAQLPASDVATTWGLVVTSRSRTVLDLARSLPFPAALSVADAALHTGLPTAELAACLQRSRPGRPGSAAARRVVTHADGRAESPLESLVRALCIEFELPPPELQAPIRLADGRWVRVDLLWERQRVVGEADGRGKYETVGELDRERQREAALVAAGFRVVRFGWPAATTDRARTARTLLRVLQQR
jgi:hypothetical protein